MIKSHHNVLLFFLSLSVLIILLSVFTTSGQLSPSKLNSTESVTNSPAILISLTPDKGRYSIDDTIKLRGEVTSDSRPLSNQRVIVEVTENNKTILNSSMISDRSGKFEVSFQVPEKGVATIIGRLVGEIPNVRTLITIPISPSWISTTIAIFISTGIITLAVFILQGLQYPRLSLTAAIALTVLAYYLFYIFSDLDPAVKAAFSVALIVPIATYIYESLAKRREQNASFEDTVGKYKNESITDDIKNIYNINEELSSHQAAFRATHDEISKCKLSKSIYSNTKRTGLMANLPGFRINRYYSYIESYNNYLDIGLKRAGLLQDSKVYDDYSKLFTQMKDAYSRLNETLYVNIFYTLSGLQEQHLSYPTSKLPSRFSSPVLLAILKSGMLGEVQEDGKKVWFTKDPNKKYTRTNAYELIPLITTKKNKDSIYSENNAYLLMRFIAREFEPRYKDLEDKIKVLDKFATTLEVPKVNTQIVYTLRDTALRIRLTGTDPNARSLTYVIIEKPSRGSISRFNPISGILTYTPSPGYFGTDKFSYKASNGILHSSTATIVVGVKSISMFI
jgi:Big-like domain-containing protein